MKKAIKRIARENPTTAAVGVLVVGAAAAIGLTWWLVERNATAATPAPAAIANVTTLQPGPMTIISSAGTSQTFILPVTTPAGQIQTAVDSAGGTVNLSSGGATWVPTGASGSSGYLTITWLNSAGAQQTTTVNYTVS